MKVDRFVSPEAQIDQTLTLLLATLHTPGWSTSRREDVIAIVETLKGQWQHYKAGTLPVLDAAVEI